jgi:ABC-type branched-subunit amino acid transport system substrate-binding protein
VSERKQFPPGVGWMPWAIAAALALAVSAIAFVPQFGDKTISALGAPQGYATGSGGHAATQGRTITSGGSQGRALGNGANAAACARGRNGGATAPGVTASEIHVATTAVTTGVGAGFLGEAVDGMQVAINQINAVGGICGRRLVLRSVNSGWDGPTGQKYIENFVNSGDVFSLVAEPDSEGLGAAIDSGLIARAGIPVVGTDGMLQDQYNDSWVFPVAASTVTNMHIIAQYAYDKLGARSASDFGIVFDTRYRFGAEGARAFNNQVRRLTGSNVPGFNDPPSGCASHYCGISSDQTGGYSSAITTFNGACDPCKVVVMLLEPQPMETWMKGEENASRWAEHLFGGEPLFDDNVGENCPGCGGTAASPPMIVWTGYRPAIQPFDAEKPVYSFCQALKTAFPKDDCHNEFTQGAYLGTLLFIEAAKRVGPNLTRDAIRAALESQAFDFGISQPLKFGAALPRVPNASMAAFQDNYSGSFNGWSYLSTGFLADPAPGKDLR